MKQKQNKQRQNKTKCYRITIDIDEKDKIQIISILTKSVLYIEKLIYLQLIQSQNKGYHLIIWTNKFYSKKKIYELRKKIGDDKRRILNDKYRPIGKQTLFYKKVYLNGK